MLLTAFYVGMSVHILAAQTNESSLARKASMQRMINYYEQTIFPVIDQERRNFDKSLGPEDKAKLQAYNNQLRTIASTSGFNNPLLPRESQFARRERFQKTAKVLNEIRPLAVKYEKLLASSRAKIQRYVPGWERELQELDNPPHSTVPADQILKASLEPVNFLIRKPFRKPPTPKTNEMPLL